AVALDLELPSSVDRASKNLGFDASGNVTVTDDTGTFTTTYAYWDDLQVKSPWFDVRAYGAEGDGATNDTVAIQAAITAAIVAGGGVVFFPAGTYVCTGVLTVAAASTGITLKGMSITASIIQYSGSVSPFLSLGVATVGFYMEDLKVIYTNALFAGTLINYTNAVRGGLNRCFLTGNAITTATYLLDLDTTIMINISHCRFAYSTYCIRGQDEDGTGYANGVSINNTCDFSEYVTGAIRNPGNGWFIGGGTVFEPTTTDTGGAIVMDVACTSRGLSIDNIWCGDATAVGTWAWIQFKGSGLSVKGSWINGTGHLTQYAIKIIGDSTGIFVAGNYMSSFHYAVGSANSPTITNVVVVGNDFPLCFNDVDIYVEAGALVQRDGNLSIGIGYGVYSTEGHGQPIKEMESPGYNIVSYENDTVYYENDVITYTSITSL
ncbi:MAG: hypothetical protein KAS32_25365, partial [Candidatus Peribacteraceae bacterium]|nr:hypothetical protein [Candidatus Peribacteraceae bacterium]